MTEQTPNESPPETPAAIPETPETPAAAHETPVAVAPAEPDPAPEVDPDADPRDARIAALEALAAQNAAAASAADARAIGLEKQAVDARRQAALTGIGLGPQFWALAPEGDPADPAVAEAIEKMTEDPKFSRLFVSRMPSTPEADLESFEARIKEKGSNAFTNPDARRENARRLVGR